MKRAFISVKNYLRGLSFRTGMIIFTICGVCYAVSFVQVFLPISTEVKGILFGVFLALAKVFQYTALTIIGPDGVRWIKAKFARKKSEEPDEE